MTGTTNEAFSLAKTAKLTIQLLVAAFIGAQSATIYFLNQEEAADKSIGKMQQSTPAITIDSQPQEQQGVQPINGPTIGDAGITGGEFFLGQDEVPYVIPKEKISDVKASKKILLAALMDMPGFFVGDGQNEAIVLFDPLCPMCHTMYSDLTDGKFAEKYDLKIKMVPVNLFSKMPQSSYASLYMLGHLLNGKPENAKAFFSDLARNMSPNQFTVDNQESVLPKAVVALNHATMALLQSGQTTPTVVFRDKKNKDIIIINGSPDEQDYADIGEIH